MSTRNWRFERCISLSKWWCSGSMLGFRGVSGVNHKRSAGPNAQWTSSLGSEHGHCSPRDVWDVGAVSVHVCSDGRPTCTQEKSRRFQVDTKHLKGVFCSVLTEGRRSRLGSFRSVFCGYIYFFCFGCFCHFGSLMFRTVLENTIKCSVSLLVYSLVVHADACLFACSFFDSKMQICWIQIAADIRPIW